MKPLHLFLNGVFLVKMISPSCMNRFHVLGIIIPRLLSTAAPFTFTTNAAATT